MYQITTERPEDAAAIDQLLDQAFGANRMSKISYRFREDTAPLADLRLVARCDAAGRVVGTLRFWPVTIGPIEKSGGTPALLLGPLAVARDWRGQGIGGALMRQGLDMAAWARHRIVVLVGDLAYYRRFGFQPATPLGLVMLGETPQRLLVRELAHGALADMKGLVQPLIAQPGRSVRRAAPRHARAA